MILHGACAEMMLWRMHWLQENTSLSDIDLLPSNPTLFVWLMSAPVYWAVLIWEGSTILLERIIHSFLCCEEESSRIPQSPRNPPEHVLKGTFSSMTGSQSLKVASWGEWRAPRLLYLCPRHQLRNTVFQAREGKFFCVNPHLILWLRQNVIMKQFFTATKSLSRLSLQSGEHIHLSEWILLSGLTT